jgi:hypothetical protein
LLLTSNGLLCQFREGVGDRAAYTVQNTRLGRECEFDGLPFDPPTKPHLLTCRNAEVESLRDFLIMW